MKSIIRLFGLGMLLSTTTLAGAVPGDTLYSRAGKAVPDGPGTLNFYCMGSGSPAVIFDAGFGDWSPSWAAVQPQVARWTRACAYDRAGYAFSDPGVMPRTSVRIADELNAALHDARISPPYVLVAHAFGSDNLRVFADRYMRDVGGMVLVDADAAATSSRQSGKHATTAPFKTSSRNFAVAAMRSPPVRRKPATASSFAAYPKPVSPAR